MRTRRPAAAGVLLFAALAALDAVGARADSPTPTCFGEPATIVGSSGDRRVDGTDGPDVIYSQWDDQAIHGLGGDDLLCGHSSIFGGQGDDRISVHSEPAFLDYSALHGGPGDDVLRRDEKLSDDPHFELDSFGGRGHDRLYGGPNLDRLEGGPGRDLVFGRGLPDHLAGGPGADLLDGGAFRDQLHGHAGDDLLRGAGRDDDLRGGPGSDVARGGPGNDRIWGGDGADVAHGGPDVDTCREVETGHCELP